MTEEEKRYANGFVRINQFGIDNNSFFTGIAVAQFTIIQTIVDGLQLAGTQQMSAIGSSGGSFDIKGIRRETLRNFLSVTSRTAKSMVFAFPGIDEQFRMPRNRSGADLLNAARAFILNGTPMATDFEAFGLSKTWFAEMTTAADEFEASLGTTASAQANRAGATAELHDWTVQGMRARRVLDGIVRNVFATDPGKLAAWAQASHIERRSEPNKPVTPVTPPTA